MKDQAFDWIYGIIKSCNNGFHFESVDKVIDLFSSKFNDDKLTTDLKALRIAKWNAIHDILV